MPRSGWRKLDSDRRLSDLVSVGILIRVFPPDLVDVVIAATGRTEQRHRSLPARLMAYFAIGMGLDSDGSYDDVMSLVTGGLWWALGWQERLTPPSKSAIFQARARLGHEPVQQLFAKVARPLGKPGVRGVWLAGRRLVAIDGSYLDVSNTPANAAFFGRRDGLREEKLVLPQARLVAVAECGTQVIFDAVVGACTSPVAIPALELIGRLQPGMLLMADDTLDSFELLRESIRTGADVLWRTGADLSLRHCQTLDDASWLAMVGPPGDEMGEPVTVRVIDHTVNDGRDTLDSYRLVTTILDTTAASASELAAVYLQRWEIDCALDEFKTHEVGPGIVLRSKSPELVLQEIWGHLCCHYAIRAFMAPGTGSILTER